MHITIPPTERQLHVESVKRAVERKRNEVEEAARKLDALKAELRGLQQALDILDPPTSDPADLRGSYGTSPLFQG